MREEPSFAEKRGERAFENDVTAMFSGAGAEIDDVIGGAHHVGIMFDYHDGVTEAAEFFEDANEAAGVAGVQANGRLVEHVAGADEARAQTGGELDALRFAAGERRREAIERQVIEPDIVKEFETLADFDEDFLGDGGLFGRKCERAEEFVRLGDVHLDDLGDVLAAHANVERFLAEARALAIGAQRVAAVTAHEDAHVELVFLAFQVVEEAADEGFEWSRARPR